MADHRPICGDRLLHPGTSTAFKQKIVDGVASRSALTTGCRRSGLAEEPPDQAIESL